MKGRRRHNRDQIRTFLDVDYPNTAPGSPDPEQNYDTGKPTSRVIAKAKALERIDNLYFGDGQISRSFDRLVREFERCEDFSSVSPVHGLAVRFVLLNVNTAGGHKELQRLQYMKVPKREEIRRRIADEDATKPAWRGKRKGEKLIEAEADELHQLAKRDAEAAHEIAALCSHVIERVLDRLDEDGLWLGWGQDVEATQRKKAAEDRRKKSVVADGETAMRAIRAYHELQLRTFDTVEEAERATMEHFGCGPTKVREAVRAGKQQESA